MPALADQQELDQVEELMHQFEDMEDGCTDEAGDLLEDFLLAATEVGPGSYIPFFLRPFESIRHFIHGLLTGCLVHST